MRVDVLAYEGAPQGGDHDFTDGLHAILSAGDSAYLPVRRIDGTITPYRVRGLALPSDATIVCESSHARIEAQDSGSWILDLTNGVHRVYIEGGTWGGECAGVLRHRRVSSGSLTTSLFSRMRIDGAWGKAGVGFEIASCAGLTWRDCEIRNTADAGICLRPAGYANANRIERCKFWNTPIGIDTVHDGDPRQKNANAVVGCWFESPNLESPAAGIIVRSFAYGWQIRECYFEQCASEADILLEAADGPPVRSVSIVGNKFATPNDAQTCRVRNVGRASYVARDNDATIAMSTTLGQHMTFASCEGVQKGGRDFSTHLRDNTLHYTGQSGDPANYAAAAYRVPGSVSNPQTVTVSGGMASAGFRL